MAPKRGRAMYDYDAKDENELTFKTNDILYIHMQDESGWWECELLGKIGFAPWNYISVLEEEEVEKVDESEKQKSTKSSNPSLKEETLNKNSTSEKVIRKKKKPERPASIKFAFPIQLDDDQVSKPVVTNPKPSTSEDNSLQKSYMSLVERASMQDFSDLAQLEFIYPAGRDSHDRPIIVFLSNRLPPESLANPEDILLYSVKVMDGLVNKDCVLVYVHSESPDRPKFAWLRQAYELLDRRFKKNIKQIYILYPTFWVRAVFMFLKPFISGKFFEKLYFVNSVSQLYSEYFSKKQLPLPKDILQIDTRKVRAAAEASLRAETNGGLRSWISGTSAPSNPLFGSTLESAVKRHNKTLEIPLIITKCVEYLIDGNHISIEGIFRIPADADEVKVLCNMFNETEDLDISIVDSPHTIAAVLKQYLRQLPEPLLTFDMYEFWISSVDHDDLGSKISAMQNLIHQLPDVNRLTLFYLIDFFCKICDLSSINKMTPANISIVFAPNLIRHPQETMTTYMTDAVKWYRLIQVMIENKNDVFA